jgi:hypothetical protein
MPTSRYSDDPALDALLDASSPPTPQGDAMTPAEARALVASALDQAAAAPRRRPGRRRALVVGAAAVMGLAGIGAAAAAVTQIDWSGWASDPDVAYTFTLPSGATCEARIGGTIGASNESVDQARAFFREHDVLAMVDVDAEIARMRAEEDRAVIIDDAGTQVDASYGTAYYPSPDEEYQWAVSKVVGELFADELEWQGGALDSHSGAIWCPDMQW